MSNIKLPYGWRDESLVHISQVNSGLRCGCTCPHCHAPLIAKKGKRNEHHFAHYKSDACTHALETALHLAAKEILERARVIKLPAVTIKFNSYKDAVLMAPAQHYPIDRLRIEERQGGLVPDLIATLQGRDLWIEVFVTHRVNAAKQKRIRQIGVSAIEIDLSKLPRDLNSEALTDAVIHDTDNKHWLHNVGAETKRIRMLQQARRLPVLQRGLALHIDHCPKKARIWRGKPYANVIDDCAYCTHCLEITGQRYVFCNGHLQTPLATTQSG